MATVLNEILDVFYSKLSETEAVDTNTIEALRCLFATGKKLKADDFVEILSAEAAAAQQ